MKIKVWDIPTRLFHWLLVAAFAAAYLTSTGERLLEYHTVAGYTALGLVLFRIIWGFAGSRHARFSDFLKGFSTVRSYLRQTMKLKPPRYLGHNPAVGWVVLLMLFLILLLTATGIITYSGEEGRGLFAGLVGYEAGVALAPVHKLLAWVMLLVITVHVSAALFHDFVLRENLILAMITGMREDEGSWSRRVAGLAPEEGRSKARLVAWLAVVVMGAVGIASLPSKLIYLEEGRVGVFDPGGVISDIPVDAAWEDECSACHGLFHPTLLPARSWRAVIASLSDHFGDDASVDPATASEIESYLTRYSAERSTSEASRKILASIGKGEVPTRVTETGYWKRKHSDIKEAVWTRPSVVNKSNCSACHPGAERGSFEDSDIGVPQ